MNWIWNPKLNIYSILSVVILIALVIGLNVQNQTPFIPQFFINTKYSNESLPSENNTQQNKTW